MSMSACSVVLLICHVVLSTWSVILLICHVILSHYGTAPIDLHCLHKHSEVQSIEFLSERTCWFSMSIEKKNHISGKKHFRFDAMECCHKSAFSIKNKFYILFGFLILKGSCHFSNLWHVCGDSFHALQFPGVDMKFISDHRKLSFLSSLLAFASRLACLSCFYFLWYPPNCKFAGGLSPE